MREVKRTIDDGPGFAIVDRLPVERWSADGARAVWWLLASLVARPVAQKWDGTSIYDVTDLGRPPGNGVRPDVTNAEQNFHTDNSYNHVPPHYVGLMCLRTAMEGGVSGIVSFATAHEEMRKRHPELLPRLYQAVLLRPPARACAGRRHDDPPSDARGQGRPAGRAAVAFPGEERPEARRRAARQRGRGGDGSLRGDPERARHVGALPVPAGPDAADRQPRARPQAHGVPRLAGRRAQAPAGAPVAARHAGAAPTTGKRQPHPEEHRAAVRLEGWPAVVVYPTLRDAALRAAPG